MKTEAAKDASKTAPAPDSSPITVLKRHGIVVRIRPTRKNGTEYFVCDYSVKGQRKQVWRSTLAEARQAGNEAIDAIAAAQSERLEITNAEVHIYLRAREEAARVNMPLDHLARMGADLLTMLKGRATPMEVGRDWLNRHDAALPPVALAKAKEDFETQIKADGKSHRRQQQLTAVLKRLLADYNGNVGDITPDFLSRWLTGLGLAEKTRKNYRDAIGYFNRWCILRGYLAKGTDWLEHVQKYKGNNHGEIEIYTPEELTALLGRADKRLVPFLAIGAFAGLRHAEIARLDWSEIDFDQEAEEAKRAAYIEVKAAKAKTQAQQQGLSRRLVPVKANLLAWLKDHRKEAGPVCGFTNITKQLLKLAGEAGMKWKHNALRHSYISYRVAECADVPRVADESGNSVTVIRTNYLRRVKPKQAAAWFRILPASDSGKKAEV